MQPHIFSEKLSPINKGSKNDRVSFGEDRLVHFLRQYVIFPVIDNLKVSPVMAILQEQFLALSDRM